MRKPKAGDILLISAALLAVFIFVYPKTRILALYDRLSMEKYTSAEGKFSLEVPKRWRHEKAGTIRMGSSVYLSVRGDVWGGRRNSARRLLMYADATVVMAPLAPDRPTPSPQELRDELYARMHAAREFRPQDEEPPANAMPDGLPRLKLFPSPSETRFEVKRIKGWQWAKTTVPAGDRTYILWQAVDGRANHYMVTFSTNNIAWCEPIFDKMIESFSFDSR